MSIIPDDKHVVKLNDNKPKDPISKWAVKKLEAEAVAKRMYRYPTLRARASRMLNCGDYPLAQYCPKCGYVHVTGGNLCRDRLCPLCGWRLSLSRYSQMLAVLDLLSDAMLDNDIKCSMLTLTLRNCTIDKLHDTLCAMSRAWDIIARRKLFRDSVYAWARSIEITYNSNARTYHPHMHILLFSYGSSLADDTQFTTMAIDAWQKSLGLDYKPIYNHKTAYSKNTDDYVAKSHNTNDTIAIVTDNEVLSIREQAAAATRAAALEVSKYIMGDKMGLKIPQAHLLEFADAIKGVRMVGYGGAIKTARHALGLIDDQIDSQAHTECAKCGAKLDNYLLKWAGCGFIMIPLDGSANHYE